MKILESETVVSKGTPFLKCDLCKETKGSLVRVVLNDFLYDGKTYQSEMFCFDCVRAMWGGIPGVAE